jgi:Fic family protein
MPFAHDFETKTVLRKLSGAHRALAELKGGVKSIPNENILISTLVLQEAKDSSAIENIITTYDDLCSRAVCYLNLRKSKLLRK